MGHAQAMFLFVATVLEQLVLALEHLSQGDVHNARFGLMLTDNALELFFHQIAKDKADQLKDYPSMRVGYPHLTALNKACGRSFEAKVKFARLDAKLSEEAARTINILHEFRNEVYHVGLQHEAILPNLALFYFDVACEYMGRYGFHSALWWSSSQKLPERAKTYFHPDGLMPGRREDFSDCCRALAKACGHEPATTIAALADHMEQVIDNQDTCIDVAADGVYEGQQKTRDKAVIDCQSWHLAFSEKGRVFAEQRGWKGSLSQFLEWAGNNYPFGFKGDPVGSWRKQVAKLRARKNPHAALEHYHSFMTETSDLREAVEETAARAEVEIDDAIDRTRGG
jgi:hypothetical protein